MALSRLGDYIELVDVRNEDNRFNETNVRGISTSKVFIKTKADLRGVNLNNYKVVNLNQFAYVADTSRRGEKIGLAYADTEACIISSIYTVFKIKDESKLLSRYLMMFFSRSEFDRYARFNSWGSARETFTWEDMCDIELEIPPVPIQQKYVDIYEGLLSNIRVHEKGLSDLKLICDGYIETLRKIHEVEAIGKYIIDTSEKNNDLTRPIAGISKEQKLIPSESRTAGVDKSKYYVMKPGEFAYSPIHINEGSIAYNDTRETFVISPIYKTFKVSNEEKLYPKYLMLWFARSEFIRYCWFNAFGSARDTFEWSQLCDVTIPVPSIEKQKAIAEVLDIMNFRKNKVEILKKTISNLCPILIRGAVKEAKGGN